MSIYPPSFSTYHPSPSLSLTLWLTPVVAVAVAPGVDLAAEGGLRLAPALTLQSLPGRDPAHLAPAPAAAPTPIHGPGL